MIYKLRFDPHNYLSFYIDAVDIELILGDFFLLDEPQSHSTEHSQTIATTKT